MGYRIIPASLVIGLTTNEAYTYFCLLAKSDYNTYISHVKLETLSQLTGISKTEYISKHIEKLIKKGLLRKDTQQNIGNKGVFNTCTYYLYKPQIDWIRIDLDLLEENIPNKLKAFLILLKCICLNNTNYTGSAPESGNQRWRGAFPSFPPPGLDMPFPECHPEQP